MRAQTAHFPQIEKVAIPPFTSVKNRSQVDRMFKLLRWEEALNEQDDHDFPAHKHATQRYLFLDWVWVFTSAEDGMGFGDSDFHHKGMNSSLFQIFDDKRDDVGPLEKKCLQLFPLDMRFQLHDLVGSGHLKAAPTPTSVVVRVSKD